MLTRLLERLYDWLSPGNLPGQADLIFVLAGRQSRKLCALDLYARDPARTLLLSVGRFEMQVRPTSVSRRPGYGGYIPWHPASVAALLCEPAGWPSHRPA